MTQGLATSNSAIDFGVSTRRVGLCWEATRAPRWTRIPQAWAEKSAQAGFLRDRQECEKSQGVWGTASPKSLSRAHRRLDGRQHAAQNFQTQKLLERTTAIQREILSIGQQGVFLAFDETTFSARQSGVFALAHLVQSLSQVAHDVELVEQDGRIQCVARGRRPEGLPHIHHRQ